MDTGRDEQNSIERSEGLTKKERRELRRQEKESTEASQARTRKAKKFFMRILILAIIAAAGYGLYLLSKSSEPTGEDFSQSIPVLSRDHIAVGATPSVEYNSNPPTSGQHYDVPARPGFREEAIADGHLIHSLEHGLVWVSYHPRIGAEAEKLREITGPLVVITSREANNTDIAVAAWGRLDVFNLDDGTIDADDLERINDFAKRYADKGPERIPAGQHGGI